MMLDGLDSIGLYTYTGSYPKDGLISHSFFAWKRLSVSLPSMLRPHPSELHFHGSDLRSLVVEFWS